jgi:hypothetical protein
MQYTPLGRRVTMYTQIAEPVLWKLGHGADPGIEMLLDKSRIAQIKVKELDIMIYELTQRLEIANMTRDALKSQYKIE